MRGNPHVPFLEDCGAAMRRGYSTEAHCPGLQVSGSFFWKTLLLC